MDKLPLRIPKASKLPVVAAICAAILLPLSLSSFYFYYGEFETFFGLGKFPGFLNLIIPVFLLLFSVLFAKKHIKLLIFPLALKLIFNLISLLPGQYTFYRNDLAIILINLLILLLGILTLSNVIKSKLPLVIFCFLNLSFAIISGIITAVTSDIFILSSTIYAVAYYLCVGILALALDNDPSKEYLEKIDDSKYRQNYNFQNGSQQSATTDVPVELLEKKSIVACILLSIFTLGIYGLVWEYALCKKTRILNNEPADCAGEFLCLILVPFYSLYWFYTRGKKISTAAAARNVHLADNSALYLILGLFGFALVALAMIQNDFNTVADQLGPMSYATSGFANAGPGTGHETGSAARTYQAARVLVEKDPVERLKEIADLKNQGIISEDEFESMKKDLLTRI